MATPQVRHRDDMYSIQYVRGGGCASCKKYNVDTGKPGIRHPAVFTIYLLKRSPEGRNEEEAKK